MKEPKTRKIFGEWIVTNPKKVIRIGFAYDAYKKPQLNQLWEIAYKRLRKEMPVLNPEKDYFYTETMDFNLDGSIKFEMRYFTPAYNRTRSLH